MRDGGSVWEYLFVYVDNIIVAMKNTQEFFDNLQGPNVGFKMKGIGKPNYHLGADFYCDEDGTLCYSPQTYVKCLCASFESLFWGTAQDIFCTPLILMIILNLTTPPSADPMIPQSFNPSLGCVNG